MKRVFTFSLLVVITFLTNSCGSIIPVTPEPQIEKLPTNYDFSPPENGFKKSKDISFILMEPSFARNFEYINYAPFTTFSKAMSNDYVEMLTKRGYRYIGPVNSYDEIVYSDKKNTDLLLESELAFELNGITPFKHSSGTTLIGNLPYDNYFADGELMLAGKINFYISEPFTHTKIWVKSIPIEAQKIIVKSVKRNYNNLDSVYNDPQVWNAFVEALQKVYTKSLQTAWNYLDPEEMTVKKKESDEIRKNSTFNKN